MRIFALWAILTSIIYVLQYSFLPILFTYNGVSVNFMLLLTGSTAFLLGHRYGVFMGFASGLLQDLTTGSYFGCSIFSYMLLGFMFGKFSNHIFKEQFFLPVFSSIFAAAVHYFIMVMFVYLLGFKLNLQWSLLYTLVPMLCYQFAFAYPIHKLVFEFNNYINKKWK